MDRLPEIDPFPPAYKTDPLAAIERVRAQSPLARSVRGLEVLTYDACADVYANENYESASPLIAASMGLDLSLLTGTGRTMTNSEGADHAVLRRTVSKWFTPRRVHELRPAAVDLVKQRIAPITARGGGDFEDEVANRISLGSRKGQSSNGERPSALRDRIRRGGGSPIKANGYQAWSRTPITYNVK